ncbi:probable leucine-rich repeat receptor-like serine/threonine-protein kinase At3g14840 isoform X3 [Cucurbita moschata]|uniref:non-specific serine/threonine protein kinase n=1 Tax=Cucurbita moschata TaxID=3662 RepID=A0A6J1FRJ9_CUCMO|nr:probable leucine-rich repeat receptor-like serine/threonine-protein kinase At3g14840 isoform X3 [Cucurbita moschata]
MFLAPFLSRLLLLSLCFISLASGAARLPDDEVEALREIGKTLGKTDWNFDADPCGGVSSGWVSDSPQFDPNFTNNVTCNCTFLNNTVCHVTNISLKAQSLPGTLPPQIVRLPFLQELDLTRNYLSGSIPPEWGSTNLLKISLLANRLTGPIPEAIGNISSLAELVLEMNQFSGSLPTELGNLTSLSRLLLTSNNFSGELPSSLARITSLTDFRISDNHFTGQIPKFVQNWTALTKIAIQASGLDGPIPSEIGLLTKLTDVRISDLNGDSSPFPPLNTLTKLKTLILRSCNITGVLPDNLDGLTLLKTLDFSFNKITGPIPASFEAFKKVDRIYLTGNLLNGPVPTWMLQEGESIDLSYNKFTLSNSENTGCQSRNLNLFASSSQDNSSGGTVSCLPSTCRTSYSLHINCGGKELINGTTTFVADADTGKSSLFFQRVENWGFSSTGNFMDDARSTDDFIALNISALSMPNPELYVTARISPISLTYYAYCMGSGNYTVGLHFAEIAFTNDTSYRSLGRRLFDVYVQGKLKLKDFNIADAAGGIGKPIVKNFTVPVTNGTIEIRLFWAGKGTTAIPVRVVYGPLISAISVDPDFEPPSEGGKDISAGAVVGIVAGIVAAVIFVIIFVLGVLWCGGCLQKKSTLEQELKGLDLGTSSFSLRQIRAATNNFDAANKIGEGGFGPVYKGVLQDGTVIAVKQLSSKSKQGNREFVNEIGMISALQHPHLVKLYGCCVEGNQLLLIYEYLENNSLARALFGPEEFQLKLDWPTRHKICVGIARGLAYLHEESRLKIVHRDIKATNVLLDKNLNPKISDFGLAKLDEEENTHISTRIAGTFGYMAPEYAMRGYLTDKADVYSFGIVALEILSGRSNTIFRTKDDCFYLLDHANTLKEGDRLLELVDPRLGSEYNQREAMTIIDIAFRCTNNTAAVRPTMSSVVSMLEGKVAVKEVVSDPSVSKQEVNTTCVYYQKGQTTDESRIQNMSIDGPWTGSSTTGSDLYPMLLDSIYLEDRN